MRLVRHPRARLHRQAVAGDLASGPRIEYIQFPRRRVYLHRFLPVFRGYRVFIASHHDVTLVGCRTFFPSHVAVLPEYGVLERPEMLPFLLKRDRRHLFRRMADLPVRAAQQPSLKRFTRLRQAFKHPYLEKIVLHVFDDVFDFTLGLRIRFPAHVHRHPHLFQKRLELPRVDDLPMVLVHHQHRILIDDQLLRHPAQIVETVQQVLNDVHRGERRVLDSDIFVPAGREYRGEDMKRHPAAHLVLAEIQLQLPSVRQFRHLLVLPGMGFVHQPAGPFQVVDVVPERLFASRQPSESFLKVIIDGAHIKPPVPVFPIDKKNLLRAFREYLDPASPGLCVPPVVIRSHMEVFSHCCGIKP